MDAPSSNAIKVAMADLLEESMVRHDMKDLAIQAARLADPEVWAAGLTKEEEGRRFKNILSALVSVMVLRGHELPPPQLESQASTETEVWLDAPEQEAEWRSQEDSAPDQEEEVNQAEVIEGEQESAAEDATKPAPAAPMLQPARMIKYGYEWWPVYETSSGAHYVLRECGNGKTYKKYVSSMAASTRASLTPVAPLPSAADIARLKAIPSGTYLRNGGVFHAVFVGPEGGSFVIVGGAKKWWVRSDRPGADPVVLQLSQLDRDALAAAGAAKALAAVATSEE